MKQDPFDQWMDELSTYTVLRRECALHQDELRHLMLDGLGDWARQSRRQVSCSAIVFTLAASLLMVPLLSACTPPASTLAIDRASLHKKDTVVQTLDTILCKQ